MNVMMNVSVTHFSNPFSFFLKEKAPYDKSENYKEDGDTQKVYSKKKLSDENHGKYVAVWHEDKWSRGVIHLETQVKIWLVDSGCYIRPDDSTVYVDMASDCKKIPSKVFEASIHGVVPIDKDTSPECEIKDVLATSWNPDAVKKGLDIIKSSTAINFVPVALMSTEENDIVLGDLYLDIPGKGTVNLIDLMELGPVFLQRNPEKYIENIDTFYSSRRKHHACTLKPPIPNRELPVITTSTCSITKYKAIVQEVPKVPKLEVADDSSSDDSTVVTTPHNNCLSAEEELELAQSYININGVQHNALEIFRNKTRDLIMCERYKDRKSAGRATSRRSKFNRPGVE